MEKRINIKERILYEDREILVCRKPAGLAVQSAKPGVPDMESLLKNYLAAGNGRPSLFIVHRLDQPVEGVLIFAKTPQVAKELSRQIAAGEMEKIYLAVTCGEVLAKEGTLEDYLKKDGRTNTSSVVSKTTSGSKRAVLSYELLEELPFEKYSGGCTAEEKTPVAAEILAEAKKTVIDKKPENGGKGITRKLLRIHLRTGRHHQIRVQMAHAGMPLLGDRKYGASDSTACPLALCAWSLTFQHPTTKKAMNFHTVPEGEGFAGFKRIPTSKVDVYMTGKKEASTV